MALAGIFILAVIGGEAGALIRDYQREFDPKLAGHTPPHVTVAGSSGVGPIDAGTPVERLREALAPIAESTAPIVEEFGRPTRFMQTEIFVLPLDPHGLLRVLHERIARSGLTFKRPRFAFTPHATLSYYPTTHPAEVVRKIMAVRMPVPAVIDSLEVHLTRDPQRSRELLRLPLTGEGREGRGKREEAGPKARGQG